MVQKNEAEKINPALKPFGAFVGEWKTEGTHPIFPEKVFHGKAAFEWIHGGAFLLLRTEIDEPEIPSGLSIFGSDNVSGEFFMLYFDERGISRKFDVSFKNNILQWTRNNSEFSQQRTNTISEDGNTIISQGSMSKNSAPWEPDLELTYKRI